jgi:molybdate transport system ATP-binding protein
MVTLSNVTLTHRGKKLFSNFSWQISAGEHWLVAGPNGAGKTFLLGLLAGAITPSVGEVKHDFVKGQTWDERYHERRRQILYVQAHALQNFLHENTSSYYQQRYYSLGNERTPTVAEVLVHSERLSQLHIPESLSIGHLLHLPVTRLSNGQLKKTLLVKSLLPGIPRLLLLDYPFEGLDAISRRELCEFIDFLVQQHDIQLVLTDHHADLPSCINRRLLLEEFGIREWGNPRVVPQQHIESIPPATAKGAEPIVVMKDVTIRYGNTTIIRGFNWSIKRGERWALVGRNGSGKTTLFSMIFADHPLAYAQEIYLFGRRRGSGESIWDIKRRIHYVGSELLTFLSPGYINQTMEAYLRACNPRAPEQVLAELLDHFHLRAIAQLPVHALSSGQLQLMLLLNCFMTRKELYLLDEPFQFLDATQHRRVSEFLQRRIDPDTTLIMITHHEQDLRYWAMETMRL